MSVIEFKCGRKHERYQPNHSIDLFVSELADKDNPNKKGKLRDISQSGMGVLLAENITKGSAIMVDLFFGNTRITTYAIVVYSSETPMGYAVGLSLEDNADAIMSFIKAKDIELNKV